MRRIRKRLAATIALILLVTFITTVPATAEGSDRKLNDKEGQSRVVAPYPSGVVTNKTESVARGFSACVW